MKKGRQSAILDIITENDIDTQGQLIEELAVRGYKCTQATISRDIKELRLVKEQTPDGVYRYAQGAKEQDDSAETLRNIFRECVMSYVCAQNIVVLKTLPGLAPAACSAVDKMRVKNLAGSLAGDDTAFIAMMDNESAELFCREIGGYF